MSLKENPAVDNIDVEDSVIAKLETFAALLMEWNRVHNLTGAKDRETIYENIVDALYPLTFVSQPERFLDVGTGAGFPGLVLAIAWQESLAVLCEPIRKRASFLRFAAVRLGLKHVEVVPKRVETIDAPPFELITSRAVTDTALLLRLTAAVSDARSRYLFYKGERIESELEGLKRQLSYDIVQRKKRYYLYIKGQA